MTEKEDTLRERIDVTLALALDSPDRAIPCPQNEELAAWHEGLLADERKNEITGHLASCTSCYLAWNDLAIVRDFPYVSGQSTGEKTGAEKPRSESTITGWLAAIFRPGIRWWAGGFGTAVVAAMLLVFMVLPTYRMHSIGRRIDNIFTALPPGRVASLLPSAQKTAQPSAVGRKSLDLSLLEQTSEDQAFAVGVARGMRSLTALEQGDAALLKRLPTEVTMQPVNVSTRVWTHRKNTLIQAGRWAVALRAACISSQPVSEGFLADQEVLMQSLARELQSCSEEDKYSFFFTVWSHAPGAEKDMCGRVKVLLEMGPDFEQKS